MPGMYDPDTAPSTTSMILALLSLVIAVILLVVVQVMIITHHVSPLHYPDNAGSPAGLFFTSYDLFRP